MRGSMRGFTLVELIMVIAVLALLSVSAITLMSNVRENARKTTARSNAQAIVRVVNMYNNLTDEPDKKFKELSDIDKDKLAGLKLSAAVTASVEMAVGLNISLSEFNEAMRYVGGDSVGGFFVRENPVS